MLATVNYPEVELRLGWTAVSLRMTSVFRGLNDKLHGSVLKTDPCLFAPVYTELLHFEPGNMRAFCMLCIVDCLWGGC